MLASAFRSLLVSRSDALEAHSWYLIRMGPPERVYICRDFHAPLWIVIAGWMLLASLQIVLDSHRRPLADFLSLNQRALGQFPFRGLQKLPHRQVLDRYRRACIRTNCGDLVAGSTQQRPDLVVCLSRECLESAKANVADFVPETIGHQLLQSRIGLDVLPCFFVIVSRCVSSGAPKESFVSSQLSDAYNIHDGQITQTMDSVHIFEAKARVQGSQVVPQDIARALIFVCDRCDSRSLIEIIHWRRETACGVVKDAAEHHELVEIILQK